LTSKILSTSAKVSMPVVSMDVTPVAAVFIILDQH
jgi:hypothetical protein